MAQCLLLACAVAVDCLLRVVSHTSLLFVTEWEVCTLIVCFEQTYASPIVPLDFAADL